MPPFYSDDRVTVHRGDCLDVLRTLSDASVDSVVTDPPYGLEFMGKDWDSFKTYAGGNPNMKPQGAATATPLGINEGGTPHATPGYRQKNPRCRRCGKLMRGNGACKCPEPQIDTRTAEGANQFQAWCEDWAREVWRVLRPGGHMLAFGGTRTWHRLACAIEDAGFEIRDTVASLGGGDSAGLLWMHGQGFPKSKNLDGGLGTALKPAFEPIVVARRPLAGTVAQTVLAHGTGALNIAATRVGNSGGSTIPSGMDRLNAANAAHGYRPAAYAQGVPPPPIPAGRWPSNVVLTHSPSDPEDGCAPGCPVADLDAQSGTLISGDVTGSRRNTVGGNGVTHGAMKGAIGASYADSGGASRFFPTFRYQAKAPTRERPKVDGVAHPTVKPLALMSWLVRLVTPPDGVVLDPFGGSGATAEAAILEGFRCITIEREAEYLPLILARIQRQKPTEAPRTVAEQMSLLDDPAA